MTSIISNPHESEQIPPFAIEVSRAYGDLACAYLKAGLAAEIAPDRKPNRQVAISNFCHCVESATKCVLADDFLPSLFNDISSKDSRYLMRPEVSLQLKRAIMAHQKLLSFKEAIEQFQWIRPNFLFPIKVEHLSNLRNYSVHALAPPDGPSLEIAAIAALWMVNHLYEANLISTDQIDEQNHQRLKQFTDGRKTIFETMTKRLGEARRQAQANIRKPHEEVLEDLSEPTTATLECPICDAKAAMTGTVDLDYFYSGHKSGIQGPCLQVSTFCCKNCGLKARTPDECELSGHIPQEVELQVSRPVLDRLLDELFEAIDEEERFYWDHIVHLND